MSALFHTALSTPGRRVEPCEPMPLCTARYSRSLDQFHPTERSSTAVIVPMDDEQPIHPVDVIVLRACLAATAALLVILTCEWIWP